MSLMSQIIQISPLLLTKYLLFLSIIPLILHPFFPSITSYVFLPILTIYRFLYNNNAYFFVYDNKTKKPICCAVIYIICNNKKYITITNRLGIAYFAPKYTYRCQVKVTHPIYKDLDFNIKSLKDNVQNKQINGSFIYLSSKVGMSFTLISQGLLSQIIKGTYFLLRLLYVVVFLLNYVSSTLILLSTFNMVTIILFTINGTILTVYIKELFMPQELIYPKLNLPTPLVIYNLKNNQPVAIVENKNVPIAVERGSYYTKLKDTLIPLKTKKYGALYFIDKKAI